MFGARQKRSYVSAIDEPRIHRPDAANEYVRRHNAAARIQAKHVIFANVSDEIVSAIALPEKRVVRVGQLSDLYDLNSDLALRQQNYMEWGTENIGIGLLIALRSGKLLRIVPNGPSATEVPTETGHFIFCENHNEFTTIQAANYAYSLGAGLRIIPTPDERFSDRILEELYSVNARSDDSLSPTSRLERIVSEIRAFVGDRRPPDFE